MGEVAAIDGGAYFTFFLNDVKAAHTPFIV